MAEEIVLPIQPPSRSKKLWLAVLLVLLIGAGTAAFIFFKPEKKPVYTGTVPQAIAQAVNYKVYYPEAAKLPAGYHLDNNSFKNPVKNGVAYTVSYGQAQHLVFSVQPKPSDAELQSFIANYIPLKLDFQTSLGQGSIGAYQGKTLASLPLINGPWVVVTAPPDVNQDHLKQILRSLKTD
jgi:hypothetical protein